MSGLIELQKLVSMEKQAAKELDITKLLSISANIKAIHVKTKSYAKHMALDEAFEDLNEELDTFNECVQGYYRKKNGKKLNLKNAEISFKLPADDKVFEAVRSHFCWIDTEEEWRSISDICYYRDVFVPKKIVGILQDKYSESFSLLLASQSVESRDLIQKALTLYEEGLSPDMRAYLLLVNNENKRTG